MRNSSKVFNVQTTVIKEENAVKEVFLEIHEDKRSEIIEVLIGFVNAEDEVLQVKSTTIKGNYYDLIMSDKPDFSPEKPFNEYKEKDLWYIVDLITEENQPSQ